MDAFHTTLARWTDFYLITGTAAAALTGLQFVVQTLIASQALRPATRSDVEGGIAAFGTPTVVHFTIAMLISAMMCVPWPGSMSLRTIAGALGAGALLYSVIVLRRARRQRSYVPATEDWVWHIALPAASYAALIVAAVLLKRGIEGSLFSIAAATLLLLCIGIHNAWDTVAYLTVNALRGSVPEDALVPPKRGEPGKETTMMTRPARAGSPDIPAATIRSAAPADLASIGRLGALLVRTHHDFDPQRFIEPTPQTESGYASFLGTQLEKPSVSILVALQENRVVGYAYAGAEGHDWMSLRGPAGVVYDIVVDPAHRGRGIGRLLLDAALAALGARGVPRVVLSTAERNTSAQRLFARAGFRRTMVEMTRPMDGDPVNSPR